MNEMGLPRDIEAEEAVLAHVLVEPKTIGAVAVTIQPADFYELRCGWAYGAALDSWMRGEQVNQIVVAAMMAKRDGGEHGRSQLEVAGGNTWLSSVVRNNIVAGEESAIWWADRVRGASELRQLVQMGSRVMADACAPEASADTIRERVASMIAGATLSRRRAITASPATVIQETAGEELETFMESPAVIQGYATGFPSLDRIIGGCVPSRVIVVAADTGAGKSMFVQNLARNLAIRDVPVLVFSTEMSAAEVVKRMVFIAAGVDPVGLRMRGTTTTGERERVRQAMDRIGELPVHICDIGGLSLSVIQSETRRMVGAANIGVVIVDHVDMVQADGKDRLAQLRAITAGLKALAQDLDVCVVAVSHINRASQREGSLAHYSLRDSASKEQDANQILLLTPVGRDGLNLSKQEVGKFVSENGYIDILVNIAKNRHGTESSVRLTLNWDAGGRFEDRIS